MFDILAERHSFLREILSDFNKIQILS